MHRCRGIARPLVSPWHGYVLPALPAAPTAWRIAPARAQRSCPAGAMPARRDRFAVAPSQGEAGDNAGSSVRQPCIPARCTETSGGSRPAGQGSELSRMQIAGSSGPALQTAVASCRSVQPSWLITSSPAIRVARRSLAACRVAAWADSAHTVAFRVYRLAALPPRSGSCSIPPGPYGPECGSCRILHPTFRRARITLPERGTEEPTRRIVASMAREHRRPLIAFDPAVAHRRRNRSIDSHRLPAKPQTSLHRPICLQTPGR